MALFNRGSTRLRFDRKSGPDSPGEDRESVVGAPRFPSIGGRLIVVDRLSRTIKWTYRESARKLDRLVRYGLPTRVARRFIAIVRSDGFGAALARLGRRAGNELGRARLLLKLGRRSAHCPYYSPPEKIDSFDAWMCVNRDNPRRRHAIEAAIERLPSSDRPRFSILVPVYNTPIDVLKMMIESVVEQTLGDWELVLVDDASPDARVRAEMQEWARRDHRISAIYRRDNGNISVATNHAAAAARGEFFVFLDHDDLLDRDALLHVASYLRDHPDTDLLYSDDDKIDLGGRRHSPQFKPGWSPELLLSFCYTGHLTAVRNELFHVVGGMRAGFEGSQDHDFWLRASERARSVGHVPQLLYHWRVLPGSTASSGNCKPASFEAGRKAVEEAFHRRGVKCSVVQAEWAAAAGCAIYRPVMPHDGPSVAILIPTRNHRRRLKSLIDSLAQTKYENYRVYIIDNASDDRATLEYLAAQPHRVLSIPNRNGRFSFAAINNTAASMVTEEMLLFLNDDSEVMGPDWLSQMVGWSRLPGVGAVGARLLFPDRRIQHAGIVHGLNEGLAGHAFRLLPWWHSGTLNMARVSRDCMAVTAACMLTPRLLFAELGGFDEIRFAVAYNDADYGYRLGDAGYRSVYCALAELVHHEGASRGFIDNPCEVAAYREVHGHRVDPYRNPHLDPESETFETRPTVVPVGGHSRPLSVLAVSHNLNCEGAPMFERDLLSRLKAAGAVDPLVLSPCDGPLRESYEEFGIEVRIDPTLGGVPATLSAYEKRVAYLARIMSEGRFRVVHANTLQSYWGVDAARRAGLPSVWSVHESDPWQSHFEALPRACAAAALACLAYPYRVVFTAKSSARVWVDLNSSGNFGLIRFAFDTDTFRAELEALDRRDARRQLGLGEQDLCVLLVGTVCERKGQHDLLHAFAGLPHDVAARMKCIVVGARDELRYSRHLVHKAESLKPDRRDRFTVVAETRETALYWRAADIFCCTSRIESYPRVVLEAMAAGLPIITTPVFGIAEQVRDSVNALIYQPGDVADLSKHLLRLARELPTRAALAEASTWVLRGLPNYRDMDRQYLHTFDAAAESAVVGGADPAVLHRRVSAEFSLRPSGISATRSSSRLP
jgi:O-antigen biosynthesis protein